MLTIRDLGRGMSKLFLELSNDFGQRIVAGVDLIERKILPIGRAAADVFVDALVEPGGNPCEIPLAVPGVERTAPGVNAQSSENAAAFVLHALISRSPARR